MRELLVMRAEQIGAEDAGTARRARGEIGTGRGATQVSMKTAMYLFLGSWMERSVARLHTSRPGKQCSASSLVLRALRVNLLPLARRVRGCATWLDYTTVAERSAALQRSHWSMVLAFKED